jgi:hypothetical protein
MAFTIEALNSAGSQFADTYGRWRARIKIRPEDLGIEDSSELRAALNLGSHHLAPPDAFDTIDAIVNKARKLVDRNSLPFAGIIEGLRYVPAGKIPKLNEDLKLLQAEFYAEADRLAVDYPNMRAAHYPTIEIALREAAKTPEAAAMALARLQQEYPANIRGRFNFSYRFLAIAAPQTAEAAAIAGDGAAEAREAVEGMITSLRSEISGKVEELVKACQGDKPLHQKSINAAFEVLANVESLNATLGDSNLARQITALRGTLSIAKALGNSEVSKELSNVKTQLEQGMAEAVAEAEAKLTSVGCRKIQID